MSGLLIGQRIPRALLVEDDDDMRTAIATSLRSEGYEVRDLGGADEATRAIETFRPDIAILDVDLPHGLNGFSLGRRLRSTTDIPFLFVTGSSRLEDRLTGFEVGGDDYVTKPFPMPELMARVRAILRRSNQLARSVWKVGDILVDEDAHTVVVADEQVDLTAIEFALLAALARNPRRVMSKVQLLTEVWGFDHYTLNLVEVHISALRRKLEAHAPRCIHTVRNVGYVLRV